MNRREALTSLGVVALGTSLSNACEPEAENRGSSLGDVPAITVEELAAALKKEGFQWRHIGRRIEFTATVIKAEGELKVRIAELHDALDTAVIHNSSAKSFNVGDKVKVHGLIVDQWYGVWQIWRYSIGRV